MRLPEDLLEDLLQRWPVARLATVRPDKSPHLVPVVFCAIDGILYSPLDGKRKSGRNLQRYQNVAANPSIALLIDDYAEDWSALWWVRIDATAERYEPDALTGAQITDGLVKKYPQYLDLPPAPEPRTFLRMVPGRVIAWTQTGSSDVIAERLVYVGGASR